MVDDPTKRLVCPKCEKRIYVDTYWDTVKSSNEYIVSSGGKVFCPDCLSDFLERSGVTIMEEDKML